MIKAFLFDYGGVMSDNGRGIELVARLAESLQVSEERAFELMGLGWDDFSSGVIEEAELWRRLEAAHGQPILPEHRLVWNKWEHMRPIPEMVALVAELKSRGFTVGLLSNTVPPTMSEIKRGGGYEGFDFAILSCEVGYAKPQPGIYELALRSLPGLQADEVVFLDDQQRFLDPAAALGMRTMLVKSPAQIIADVHALLEEQA